MAEWESVEFGNERFVLRADSEILTVVRSSLYDGRWYFYTQRCGGVYLAATDAEAAKAEAVALFREKLEAALKEIEGL